MNKKKFLLIGILILLVFITFGRDWKSSCYDEINNYYQTVNSYNKMAIILRILTYMAATFGGIITILQGFNFKRSRYFVAILGILVICATQSDKLFKADAGTYECAAAEIKKEIYKFNEELERPGVDLSDQEIVEELIGKKFEMIRKIEDIKINMLTSTYKSKNVNHGGILSSIPGLRLKKNYLTLKNLEYSCRKEINEILIQPDNDTNNTFNIPDRNHPEILYILSDFNLKSQELTINDKLFNINENIIHKIRNTTTSDLCIAESAEEYH